MIFVISKLLFGYILIVIQYADPNMAGLIKEGPAILGPHTVL